jgi:protein PsiE
MFVAQRIELADLFMLFIYAEILAMVGAFYSTNRIPVTLPIIVAITALCRLIIMQSKEMDGMMVMWESVAILILAGAAYLMSMKDKMSLEKLKENSDKD